MCTLSTTQHASNNQITNYNEYSDDINYVYVNCLIDVLCDMYCIVTYLDIHTVYE